MKNLKNNRWLAGMAMVVLLLGVFFVVKGMEKKETKKQNQEWFIFNGSTVSEEADPSMYEPYTGAGEPSGCNGNELNCAILAVPDASNPDQPDLTQVDESSIKKQNLPAN